MKGVLQKSSGADEEREAKQRALRVVVRENVPFFVVAFVVIGFMVALLTDFSGRASVCKFELNETKQYFCYLNEAVDERDVRLCNKLWESDERNSCFLYYAIQTRDFGPCSFIPLFDGKDYCHANVAFMKRDSELCAQVHFSVYRDSCYERIAVSERDESVCAFMENVSARDICVASVRSVIVLKKKQG